ncbi:MAG: hypothetical protein ACRD3L_01385 [Terriglobales bacterium]
MAEDMNKHAGAGFETQDLRSKTIIGFFVALAAVCVLVFLLLRGLYGFLDADVRAHQPSLGPLAPPASADTRDLNKSEVKTEIQKVFPNPRLEEDERGELKTVLLDQEQKLNSYGWVDEKAGVARIPIERAMQLVAERGLPTTPKAGIAPAAAGKE